MASVQTFSQTPQIENLAFNSGDDFVLGLDINIDVTAFAFNAYIEDSNGSQTNFTVTIISAPNGKISLSLTGVQTATLGGSGYTWAFKWTDTAGKVLTVLAGAVEVTGA